MAINYRLIWRSKWKILEGWWNSTFPKQHIKRIAAERRKICEGNVCGFYDKFGSADIVELKGKPACGFCGCNIKYMTHCLSCSCSLKKEEGRHFLWDEIMDYEQEQKLKQKANYRDT